MPTPDRHLIKAHAKSRVLDESFGIIPVAFMYLLFTDWVSTILGLTVQNPITSLFNVFYQSFSNIMNTYQAALTAGGSPAAPSLSPAYTLTFQTARELLSQPTQQVRLFVFLLLFLYGVVMDFGFLAHCLKSARDEKSRWTSLFDAFELAGKVIVIRIFTWVLTYVGLFFMVLPGIIMNYGLMMAPYILLDEPELNAFQAMGKSLRISQGYKHHLILLDISFVGWMALLMLLNDFGNSVGAFTGVPAIQIILAEVCYTVGACFVLPYRSVTNALYYDFIRRNQPAAVTSEQ